MPLFIREEDVEELLTMDRTLAVVEEAFRLHGLGEADNQPRQRPRLARSMVQVMPAAVPGMGLGLKAYSVGTKGVRFIVLLWNEETGDLEAVIEANKLGQMRTGAASGVATKYLAREDAATVGVFGAGWQAGSQLEAVCAVRPIEQVWVYGRTPANREQFAAEMSAALGVSIDPVAEPQDVVAEADIVVTITNASEPLFDGSWLRPGTHVNAAGSNRANAREIDSETVRRADTITIDDWAQGHIEAGDLIKPIEGGVITWDDVIELGQVVAGEVPGRQEGAAITVFESLGIAIEDVAVARRVYEKALEAGAGERLPNTILG
ncbi:MAG: Delta(1)-pyrroline-2-carboxylate reductase [Anaerolineales bacterium]|nr:Delta(1)-pyrroline-2-carboxylate reductase [Anaerolineales bacterium]